MCSEWRQSPHSWGSGGYAVVARLAVDVNLIWVGTRWEAMLQLLLLFLLSVSITAVFFAVGLVFASLVVNQANGNGKCRSALFQPFFDTFTAQAKHFARIRIRHIKRSQNLAGIALDQRRR